MSHKIGDTYPGRVPGSTITVVPVTQGGSFADIDVCPHCEGVGAYWDDQTGQPDEPYGGRMVECHVCEGEGVVDTSPCIGCGAPVYDHDEGCPVVAEEEVRA